MVDFVTERHGNEAFRPNGTYFGGQYGSYTPYLGNYGGQNPGDLPGALAYPRGNGNFPGAVVNPIGANAENAGMRKLMRELYNAIENNKTKAITTTWSKLMDQFRNTQEYKLITANGDEASEQAAMGRLQEIYKQSTGKDILEQIDECTSGNIMSGVKNGMSLGLAQDKSSDQLKSEMFKTEDNTFGTRVVRSTGAVAGGAAAGAAIGAGIGVWFGGVGAGPGALIGAGIGATAGLISKIWS